MIRYFSIRLFSVLLVVCLFSVQNIFSLSGALSRQEPFNEKQLLARKSNALASHYHKEKKETEHRDDDDDSDHENSKKRGRKRGKPDKGGSPPHYRNTQYDSDIWGIILIGIFVLNSSTSYADYPYDPKSDFNFFSGYNLKQKDDPGRKKRYFMTFELSSGLFVPPQNDWGYHNSLFNASIHSRFFSVLGIMLEYRKLMYENKSEYLLYGGLDLALLQMLASSISVNVGFKGLGGALQQDAGLDVGIIFQCYPFKPFSLYFSYNYLGTGLTSFVTIKARLGVHLWRTEIFTGYYRHILNGLNMDGIEMGLRLWI